MRREQREMSTHYELEMERSRALDQTNAALRAELTRFVHRANRAEEIAEENRRLKETNAGLVRLRDHQQSMITELEEAHKRMKGEFEQTRRVGEGKLAREMREENRALREELGLKIGALREVGREVELLKSTVEALEEERRSLGEEHRMRVQVECQTAEGQDRREMGCQTKENQVTREVGCQTEEGEGSVSGRVVKSGLVEKESERIGEVVLPPMKLKIEREFNNGVLISWVPPPMPCGEGHYFDIFVDQERACSLPAKNKPKHILDEISHGRLTRISVVNRVDHLSQSDPAQCTLVIGNGSSSRPTEVGVSNVTGYSVTVKWLPGNSNCHHIVYINGSDMAFVKPGVVSASISQLRPQTEYQLAVTAVFVDPHKKKRITTDSDHIFFTTTQPCPFDVATGLMMEPGPQANTVLVSWRPICKTDSISGPKGYAIYVDGELVKKVLGHKSDYAVLPSSCLRKGFARGVTIRTMSFDGTETADSKTFEISKDLICNIFQITKLGDLYKPDYTIPEEKMEATEGTEESRERWPAVESENSTIRYFVALYTYDPRTMSPNQDTADEEISFVKDDIIKVYGEMDSDGFYQGECRGKFGYVPSNVVKEVTQREESNLYLAILDYDPLSAINPTSQTGKQIRLKRGELISVKGPVNSEGFCLAASKGEEGFVPINYLRRSSNLHSSVLNFEK